MRKWVNWLIFSAVGIILAIGAFIFNLWILPMMIDYQVGQTMALQNGSSSWDFFVNTPVPMYLKVYFFNVENPEDILRGEKPKVREIGPYVYKETRKKYDVKFNPENDTVFYHQGVRFTFDAEKSHPRSDNDKIVLINFVLHLIFQVVESFAYPLSLLDEIVELGLPLIMPGNFGPTVNLSVKEILFDGMLLQCNANNATTFAKAICSALKHFPKIKILSETDDGNLLGAILRFKNTTYDGLFEINRGVKDFASLGKIVSWEHKTLLNTWNGDYCNKFVGSYDMTLLPPLLTKDSTFSLYSTDICTTAPIQYCSDIEYRGISGLRFKTSPEFMGNMTKHPKYSCYCPGSIGGITTSGQCPPLRTIDLATCMNIPALLSYPHLMDASPYYQSLVDGLKPDPALHETYLDIEPTTGIPLRGYKRFQLNILSKPTSAVRFLKNTTFALFPVLWFEEGAELSDALLSMLRDQLLKVLYIANIVRWVLIACGLCMAVIGIGMAIWSGKKAHQHPD